MHNRTYTKYRIKDYILIGKTDAWRQNITKEDIITEIITTTCYSYKTKLKIIKNYILGYKIGQLEILLSKCEEITCFNIRKCRFEKLTEESIEKTSFKKGYHTFKEEAEKEARKILK